MFDESAADGRRMKKGIMAVWFPIPAKCIRGDGLRLVPDDSMTGLAWPPGSATLSR
jgi:hypothetical protein